MSQNRVALVSQTQKAVYAAAGRCYDQFAAIGKRPAWSDYAEAAADAAIEVLLPPNAPPGRQSDTATEAAIDELRSGDGTYYITQERAFAPGISGEWPQTIKHPKNKNGRLVRRTFPGARNPRPNTVAP